MVVVAKQSPNELKEPTRDLYDPVRDQRCVEGNQDDKMSIEPERRRRSHVM